MPYRFFILFFLSCFYINAQSPFETYKSSEEVSYINVSPQMFLLLSKLKVNTNDPDTQAFFDTVQQIRGFKVMSTQQAAIAEQMAQWVSAENQTSDLEPIVNLNEGEVRVSFSAAFTDDPNRVKRLIMYVEGLQKVAEENNLQLDAENLEYVLLEIKGNIALDQLARLTDLVDIPGGQFLQKLN